MLFGLDGINWKKVGAVVGIGGLGIATVTTTSIIAHELIVANDHTLKIKKVEELGELYVDSNKNINYLFVKLTFNKPIGKDGISKENNSEVTNGELTDYSNGEVIYTNGNKVEVAIFGGCAKLPGTTPPTYTLSSPVVVGIKLASTESISYECELSWELQFCSWTSNDGNSYTSGQHVTNLKWTADPVK